MNLAEQRRDPRVRAVAPVRYESRRRKLQEITDDISLGGVFVTSDLIDEVGTAAELEIMLPGTGMIVTLRGEVRWNTLEDDLGDPYPRIGMGIGFTELEPWAREILLETFGTDLQPIQRAGNS